MDRRVGSGYARCVLHWRGLDESSYFCRTCSLSKKVRVSLYNKARRLEEGSDLTCSQVWHQTWRNGTAIPAEIQHKIRFVQKRRVDDGDAAEDFF
eukprot:jgi/Phyca11/132154/e_gw1.138.16.1